MLSNELHLVVLEYCLKGVALTQANWWVLEENHLPAQGPQCK